MCSDKQVHYGPGCHVLSDSLIWNSRQEQSIMSAFKVPLAFRA
uniref:Uncharacterized protein n=1 Tax=Anguilla anguilla TaxID=7936 RepID=A0A0E9S1R4_ANGAN